ncbi:hypothetical protein WJX74_002879 [Apatococcus lobatus]|uniref:Uncharacterized protein n=1 Tax=Apatococcus lobatus TaxID=904363 RepID=A0AAW1RAJ0_9CHLO
MTESKAEVQRRNGFPAFTEWMQSRAVNQAADVWFVLRCSKVCSQPCSIEEPFCQPLAQLILGIKPSLMNESNAAAAIVSHPPAAINTECTTTGRGLLWEHAALGQLGTQSPASGQRCKSFSLTLSSSLSQQLTAGKPLTLADICQQDILVFDGNTGQRQPQSFNGTGICMFHLRLQEPVHMFGTPVVEVTPRTQYGATAYGLLGETKSTTTRTLFGQPDPPPPLPRKMRDPTLMDPSTFLRLSLPLKEGEEEGTATGAEQFATSEETKENPKRHGQLEALESMNNPMREAPLGLHLYDILGARHGLLSSSRGDAPTGSSTIKAPSSPLPDIAKAYFGDSLNRPDAFVPLEEGLFGSSRRLLQFPPPPFPPSQPIGLPTNGGDSYASYASVVGAGYYGVDGSTSITTLAIPPGG